MFLRVTGHGGIQLILAGADVLRYFYSNPVHFALLFYIFTGNASGKVRWEKNDIDLPQLLIVTIISLRQTWATGFFILSMSVTIWFPCSSTRVLVVLGIWHVVYLRKLMVEISSCVTAFLCHYPLIKKKQKLLNVAFVTMKHL